MFKLIVGSLIFWSIGAVHAASIESAVGYEQVAGQPDWSEVGITWRGAAEDVAGRVGVRQVTRYGESAQEMAVEAGLTQAWGGLNAGATVSEGADFLPSYGLHIGATVKTSVEGLNLLGGMRFQDYAVENSRNLHLGFEYYVGPFRVALIRHQGGPVSAPSSGVTSMAAAWYGSVVFAEVGYAQGRDTERMLATYLTQDVTSAYIKTGAALSDRGQMTIVLSQTEQGSSHRRRGAAVNFAFEY